MTMRTSVEKVIEMGNRWLQPPPQGSYWVLCPSSKNRPEPWSTPQTAVTSEFMVIHIIWCQKAKRFHHVCGNTRRSNESWSIAFKHRQRALAWCKYHWDANQPESQCWSNTIPHPFKWIGSKLICGHRKHATKQTLENPVPQFGELSLKCCLLNKEQKAHCQYLIKMTQKKKTKQRTKPRLNRFRFVRRHQPCGRHR